MQKQLLIKIDEDLKKKAQMKALDEGVSLKSVIENGLKEYVK